MIKLKTINKKIPIKFSTFPAGEEYVKIMDIEEIKESSFFEVEINSAESKWLLRAVLLADAIKQINNTAIVEAYFNYLPYGRQDRVCKEGESFSLDIIMKIFKLRFDKIKTYDVHSKVSLNYVTDTDNAFQRCYINAITRKEKYLNEFLPKDALIVAPDKGAVQRANKLGKYFDLEVTYVQKVRGNGRIRTIISEEAKHKIKLAKNIIVSDDICDGGGTFLGLANAIEKITNAPKILIISHAIFSKGLLDLSKHYQKILVTDDRYNLNNI